MRDKIKVLVADDIDIIAKNVSDIVSKSDLAEIVGIAKNGKEEYEKIIELKPDIIFTDNKMPEMNGIDVIEKICNLELENEPEFVLITGDRDIELINKANNLGVLRIINKPIVEEKIIEVIKEYKEEKNKVINFDDVKNKIPESEKKKTILEKVVGFFRK